MRRKRRPDLMTALWLIAATGVLFSTWSQARAGELSFANSDIAGSKLTTNKVILRLGSPAQRHGDALPDTRWFFGAGKQGPASGVDLRWNLARDTGPITQLIPGDAYVLVGLRRDWN